MKVESSIKENYSSTTTEPITDIAGIVQAICEWNWITRTQFLDITGAFREIWKDSDWKPLYMQDDRLVNPIGMYLLRTYDWKEIVFEKGNDKFFWKMQIRADSNIRYQLWEKVIEIPFRIKAVNEDTGDSITIFPKTSDIIQWRMRKLYVVNTGWAERQRIEKEIMAKLIELSQVRGWNEIISAQNSIEEIKTNLKKMWIDLELVEGKIYLHFPRRTIRDTAQEDDDYIAPPIVVEIDFNNREVKCKGYSSHGFGTPTSWGNPCWWSWENDIRNCVVEWDLKALVNLIISWAYGYNSDDTWRYHDWRHPLAKLRDYVWRVYEHRNEETEWRDKIKQWIRDNYAQIEHDLNIDNWFNDSTTHDFISSLGANNETSEQW